MPEMTLMLTYHYYAEADAADDSDYEVPILILYLSIDLLMIIMCDYYPRLNRPPMNDTYINMIMLTIRYESLENNVKRKG
jgi:hypothetical protein